MPMMSGRQDSIAGDIGNAEPATIGRQKGPPSFRERAFNSNESERRLLTPVCQKSTCALILAYRAGTMLVGSSHEPPGTKPWL